MAFGQRTTLNELFGLIRDEVVRHKPEAAEAKPAYRDFRAGDVRHSLADITRARTLLGYEPEYDVRQACALRVTGTTPTCRNRGDTAGQSQIAEMNAKTSLRTKKIVFPAKIC